MTELEQLVKMANQIAANFSFHPDGVERLADHLKRFWAPSMIRLLQDHAASGSTDLTDVVHQALQRLASKRPPTPAFGLGRL